jgi:glycosyltransferase involved in cell wall biosynthesis
VRILVLAPFPPRVEGVHGGSRVIAQRLVRTAERHDVTLVHLQQTGTPDPELSTKVAIESVEQRADPSVAGRFVRAARARSGLLAGRPLWVAETGSSAFAARLKSVAKRFRPDVVQLEYAVMAQYLAVLSGSRAARVLIDHDPDREAALIDRTHRVLRRLDRAAWRRFERLALSAVDATVVFTERDRMLLGGRSVGTPVFCIPVGADWDAEPVVPAGGHEILFVGNFVHGPNVDAARRLVRTIFPAVRAAVPDATLVLLGPDPPTDLSGAPGVQVTGRVPEVRSYYERAAVFVAPLDAGGGMRVKVADALVAGLPVIATPLALAGLSVVDGEHVLVAESDDDLAKGIVGLLGDPACRAALGGRAAAWARVNLGWEPIIDAYDVLYDDIVGAR